MFQALLPFIFLITSLLPSGIQCAQLATQFRTNWALESEHTMAAGEQLHIDFADPTQDNRIFGIKLIDLNEQSDVKYSHLCSVSPQQLSTNSNSKTILHNPTTQEERNDPISDFLIIESQNTPNQKLIAFILSSGKFTLTDTQQTIHFTGIVNPNLIDAKTNNDDDSINDILQPYFKLAYLQKFHSIIVYTSTKGHLFSLDLQQIPSLLNHEQQQQQQQPPPQQQQQEESEEQLEILTNNKNTSSGNITNSNSIPSKEQIEIFVRQKSKDLKRLSGRISSTKALENDIQVPPPQPLPANNNEANSQIATSLPSFIQIKNTTLFENAKKILSSNNEHILIITIDEKIKGFNFTISSTSSTSSERELTVDSCIFDISEDSTDIFDAGNLGSTLVILDKTKGISMYKFDNATSTYQPIPDLSIPLTNGTILALQSFQSTELSQDIDTIYIGTSQHEIYEYFIDLRQQAFTMNKVIQAEHVLHHISITPNGQHLFISSASADGNYFEPVGLPTVVHPNEKIFHNVFLQGLHNIRINFLKSAQILVAVIDDERIEMIEYIIEREIIKCNAESTTKVVSNVNSHYEYSIEYSSTNCAEKRRFFESGHDDITMISQEQAAASILFETLSVTIQKRSSVCTGQGAVRFVIDFSEIEKEEAEIGVIVIALTVFIAVCAFSIYKYTKLQQMFALKEQIQQEAIQQQNQLPTSRKRIKLTYSPLPVIEE